MSRSVKEKHLGQHPRKVLFCLPVLLFSQLNSADTGMGRGGQLAKSEV